MNLRASFLLTLGLIVVAVFAVDPFAHVIQAEAGPGDAISATWADLDCSGGVGAPDGLVILQAQADVATSQAEYCPIVGSPVSAGAEPTFPFGDIDCNGVANLLDTLILFKNLAGFSGAAVPPCPEIGASVQLEVLAGVLTADDTWRDYGDAPDGSSTGYTTGATSGSFPTLPANGGPSHATPFGAVLGEAATVEDAPSDGGDSADDGLMLTDLHACAASEALLLVNSSGLTAQQRSQPLYVNVFADWNQDGDWADSAGCAPEAAVVNHTLDVSDDVSLDVYAVDLTGGAQVDEFWMRIVLTTQPYTAGMADMQGETEDYLIEAGQVAASPLGGGIAVPQDDKKINKDFICKGAVVPHGNGKITLDVQQTQDSKTSGFKIKNLEANIGQPTDTIGANQQGITIGGADIKMTTLNDGRTQIRLTANVTSTQDGPDRLVGPLIIEIKVTGKDQKGKAYAGSIYCGLYIDHTAGATELKPGIDGFTGGPGRAGDPGVAQPEFIVIPHGENPLIRTDATEGNDDAAGPKYDQTSLTVFGPDGAELTAADYGAKAGIVKISPAKAGRAIKIETKKDPRDDPVQPIVIRIKGKLKDNTPFTDYYRIIIVHEKGQKANKLVKDFGLFFISNNHSYQEEDDAIALTYSVDEIALASQIPPVDGATFASETLCSVTGGDFVISPISYAGAGDDAPGWESRGGFEYKYSSGAGDYFSLYDPLDPTDGAQCNDPDVATNLTGYGSSSPYTVEHPSWCYNAYAFTEINRPADTVRLAYVGQSGPFPLAGGDGYRDASCFYVTSGAVGAIGLTARKVNGDGTSDAWYVPYCNPDCPNGTTLPATPQLLIEAPGANQHILGAVVSPDDTKIAWTLATLTPNGQSFVDGQVWVADFDGDALTVSNPTVLTVKGLNLHPQWSPDSLQIAFDSNRDGNTEVYIMDADGSHQTNVTNTPDSNETQPAWQTP